MHYFQRLYAEKIIERVREVGMMQLACSRHFVKWQTRQNTMEKMVKGLLSLGIGEIQGTAGSSET